MSVRNGGGTRDFRRVHVVRQRCVGSFLSECVSRCYNRVASSFIHIRRNEVRRYVFETDHVVRYGGDEFVVLTRAPMADLLARLEELCQHPTLFAYETDPRLLEHFPRAGVLSATVGVCSGAERAQTWQEMLVTADRRMYAGKCAGGDQAVTAG